ncbi:MAG: hypothetical protein ABW061_25405, partial [Polyangiaceae bacterium]
MPTAPVDRGGMREHSQTAATQATTQPGELAGEQLIDSAKHGEWSLSVKGGGPAYPQRLPALVSENLR